jgi:CheY-like chemotaxis protein
VPKILLVEDDGLMSRMYGRLFGFAGYDTEIAVDGEDGLAKANEFKPDIILLDVMMPKMNGLELIKKLKEDPQTHDIMVVLLTNLGIQEKLDEAMAIGAAACITKSNHQPEEIVQMIADLLSKKNSNQAQS